ncbi:protease modulator HflC [Stakelama saccharophila]|uniref:Protein HflC n=1 Tax=Stakelama saccharophila TaxID=3075605 RepID=A0ABZ0B9U4_9SPHN|nr:protease modulator HflC [Stakelama sp. W311]WNO54149.1 protease modulator HflC [Stakelama sp. W311]
MSRSLFRNPMVLAILVLVLAIVGFSSLAIVPETKQVVILRFEKPVATVNAYVPGRPLGRSGAGMIARIPFVDRLVWVDKRVLDIDLENQPVLSTDQLRLEVDAFALFRVVDPLRMVVTAGTEEDAAAALKPILGSALRNELGKRQFAALLSPERGQVMDNIQAGLARIASQYGIEIVDVRIKHADLPDGSPLQSALKRMATARQQEALTIRAQGLKQAQIIRADADAQAASIYAEAFSKDAEFYDFWRAMQSYRHTFGVDGTDPKGNSSFILSPGDGYLGKFANPDR